MKALFEHWRKYIIKEEMTRDGAAIVFIFNENDELLIVKRNDEAPWMPNKWAVPGGGIEKGEDPSTAAKREVQEEVKLDIDKLSSVKSVDDQKGKIHHFVTKASEWSGTPNINFEHTDHAWVKLEDLKNYDIVPKLEKDAIDAQSTMK